MGFSKIQKSVWESPLERTREQIYSRERTACRKMEAHELGISPVPRVCEPGESISTSIRCQRGKTRPKREQEERPENRGYRRACVVSRTSDRVCVLKECWSERSHLHRVLL
ncbi:hypothetical protein BCV70DRAFT_105157 [Testicularia cyperi]|uniref:Uncharacterized protein n=1 Tax=Testicularia cyperi TaxID=1882483 RepID=A0A317XQE3_9BASI|nr:hypothetical protein BCV70DRAFT_105157 [Testicularia cyperi]